LPPGQWLALSVDSHPTRGTGGLGALHIRPVPQAPRAVCGWRSDRVGPYRRAVHNPVLSCDEFCPLLGRLLLRAVVAGGEYGPAADAPWNCTFRWVPALATRPRRTHGR